MRVEEKVSFEIKVKTKDVFKYFEIGESVRVIAGSHSGDCGIIASITDKHAVVQMEDDQKSELNILMKSNHIPKS